MGGGSGFRSIGPAMEMAIAKQATSKNTNEATYEGHGRARMAKSTRWAI